MTRTIPRPRGATGVTAVHSLDHFVFSVPDLDAAARFYDDFGLEVRRSDDRLHLHTAGHSHRWGTVLRGGSEKRLQYLAFGAYAEDFDALQKRLAQLGVKTVDPHPQAETSGIWFRDPEGVLVHVLVAPKVSPATKVAAQSPAVPRGAGAAPARSKAAKVRPRRLSHVLLFTSDVARSRSILCRRARAAPVRPFRRRHRVHARRACERPSHARVREVRRPGTPSFELGRRVVRRGRPRHGADAVEAATPTAGASAGTWSARTTSITCAIRGAASPSTRTTSTSSRPTSTGARKTIRPKTRSTSGVRRRPITSSRTTRPQRGAPRSASERSIERSQGGNP